MLALTVGQKTYQVPDKIEELSPGQFLLCLEHLFGEPTPEGRAAVAYLLLPSAVRRQLPRFDEAQRADVAYRMTAWMGKVYPASPLKRIRIGLQYFHLPLLERMSIIEAAMAQQYLEAWQSTRSQKYLDLAVATLCRPRKLWIRLAPWARWFATKWNGDERELYNGAIVERRAEQFAKLPMAYKMAVIWHFTSIMRTVRRQFHPVFNYRGEGSRPAPLTEMVFGLAGSELGDYIRVSHTPFVTALYLLQTRLP